jgi:hypothetical protein
MGFALGFPIQECFPDFRGNDEAFPSSPFGAHRSVDARTDPDLNRAYGAAGCLRNSAACTRATSPM